MLKLAGVPAGNQSDKAAAVQTHFNNAAQNVQLQHLEQSDSQGSR